MYVGSLEEVTRPNLTAIAFDCFLKMCVEIRLHYDSPIEGDFRDGSTQFDTIPYLHITPHISSPTVSTTA